MRKMAGLIQLQRVGSSWSFTIDGDDFPWHVAEGGIRYEMSPGGIPVLWLQILADRVEITDDMSPIAAEVVG